MKLKHDILDPAQKIWDYCRLNHKPEKSDVIIVWGSIDTLPAERGSDLLLDGWAEYMAISGREEETQINARGIGKA